MVDDFTDVFGVEFLGLRVDSYQAWPSIDGHYLGLRFHHPDGSQTNIALPQESLDRLLQEIEKASIACKSRLDEHRH